MKYKLTFNININGTIVIKLFEALMYFITVAVIITQTECNFTTMSIVVWFTVKCWMRVYDVVCMIIGGNDEK